jgi:4-hydroxyproline epimerase
MSADSLRRIQVIDSHTGGEPTRVVLSGCPELGGGTVTAQMQRFREQHDMLRSAIACEPRGSEAMVGAVFLAPSDPGNAAGVFFFNNVGYLGMCGHGTIGLIATLRHMGLIMVGPHRIETPVGIVTTELHDDGSVSVQNVPSYRLAKDVRIDVEDHGSVTGDIAWGGNWFFLVSDHGQELSMKNLETLTSFSWRIRQALARENITGRNGAEIDHIELFGPSKTADSQNFVLCPGKAYDRSPCGTGTSAKLACLFVDGKLSKGQAWKQESIIGSTFEGTIHRASNADLIPTIKGSAHITAESTLILDPTDPFIWGIRA